ncbi:hypothetical protein Scep_015340 [Stephania cephalantha]|uniref:Uncharacterized protein n=1 Tax=Stephania cephalantha TaxID=152367 RepID=A0AAP0J2Z7_9MAGN
MTWCEDATPARDAGELVDELQQLGALLDEIESSEKAFAKCRGSSHDFKDSIAVEHPVAICGSFGMFSLVAAQEYNLYWDTIDKGAHARTCPSLAPLRPSSTRNYEQSLAGNLGRT